jgi:hypothetical protein
MNPSTRLAGRRNIDTACRQKKCAWLVQLQSAAAAIMLLCPESKSFAYQLLACSSVALHMLLLYAAA